MSGLNNNVPNPSFNTQMASNNSADVLRQMTFNMQADSGGQMAEIFNEIREKFRAASGNTQSLMVGAMDCAEHKIHSPPADESEDED